MIHLALGAFEIDWGKNNVFTMHGELFQPGDVKDIPYRYVDAVGERTVEMREGAARPLSLAVGRLELLGFTLDSCRAQYDSLAREARLDRPPIAFEVLADALRRIDVDKAIKDYETEYEMDYEFGEFGTEVLERIAEQFKDYNLEPPTDETRAKLTVGAFFESLSPYAILRLLAENPANRSREVTWSFADVLEGGWIDRSEIVQGLGAQRKFLVVTEGSSDAAILRHALELLRPDVADFFYFVDMEEGYPFTGTGNLHRFCQGLVGIGIENRVLIVYDNDAEGVAKFRATASLSLPKNMRVMKLPDQESFRAFSTVGPQGDAVGDINGCAAAIESYLDLSWNRPEPAKVRWTAYNDGAGSYQGVLEKKQEYVRRFLDLRTPPVEYDFSKIQAVLDAMIRECTEIAVAVQTEQ